MNMSSLFYEMSECPGGRWIFYLTCVADDEVSLLHVFSYRVFESIPAPPVWRVDSCQQLEEEILFQPEEPKRSYPRDFKACGEKKQEVIMKLVTSSQVHTLMLQKPGKWISHVKPTVKTWTGDVFMYSDHESTLIS